VFDHGNYKTKELLLLGFLFCKHPSEESQNDAIWGIVNHEFKETIPRESVKEVLEIFVKFSVDSPKKYQLY